MQKTSKKNRVIYTIIFWTGLIIIPILAGISAYFSPVIERNLQTISILASIMSAFFGLFLFKGTLIEDWRRLSGKWLKVFGWVAVGFVFRIILTTILTQVVPVETSENQVALEGMLGSIPLVLFATMIVATAPITEELFFREVLLGWTNSKLSKWIMAIVSVLFFSFMHTTTDPLSVVLYIPIAIPIVWIYYHFDKNVITSILFHVVNNAIALIVMLQQ